MTTIRTRSHTRFAASINRLSTVFPRLSRFRIQNFVCARFRTFMEAAGDRIE